MCRPLDEWAMCHHNPSSRSFCVQNKPANLLWNVLKIYIFLLSQIFCVFKEKETFSRINFHGSILLETGNISRNKEVVHHSPKRGYVILFPVPCSVQGCNISATIDPCREYFETMPVYAGTITLTSLSLCRQVLREPRD